MKLADDWRVILRRAWSVRLMLLAGLLSGVEVILPLIGHALPINPGAFAALSGLTVMAAFVMRLIAQKDLNG